jgi:hypothetical protein
MSDWPDLNKPETLVLSKEVRDCYRNDNTCLHNDIARKNSEQSLFKAMFENRESYEKIRIGNQSINEMIKEL